MSEILTREFSLGDVLSITTGRLVSERHMDGVYDILNWMTGDNLFTHQLPRAIKACGPVLAAQFPWCDEQQNVVLREAVSALTESLQASDVSRDTLIADWLAALKAQYGDSFRVVPLRQWESRNPISELVEMIGAEKVIVIQAPSSDEFPAHLDS